MLIPFWGRAAAAEKKDDQAVLAETTGNHGQPHGKKRRGATAMEYLVMISFILVVAIVGIQKFGTSTKKVMQKAANATGKTAPK